MDNLTPILGKWVPILFRYCADHHFVYRFSLKNGLKVFYPEKVFSIPANLRVIAPEHPEDLNNKVLLMRVTVREGRLTKFMRKAIGIFNIELIYPKRPDTKPKYKMIITSAYCKCTTLGGRKKMYFNVEPLIKTCNDSNTGRHWIEWYVFLLPLDAEVKGTYSWVSNWENHAYEKEILIDGGIKETEWKRVY